jgi:hypothetical protein
MQSLHDRVAKLGGGPGLQRADHDVLGEGLHIPLTAAQQTIGAEVPSIDQLLPGDLVWSGRVAMVTGDGQMVEGAALGSDQHDQDHQRRPVLRRLLPGRRLVSPPVAHHPQRRRWRVAGLNSASRTTTLNGRSFAPLSDSPRTAKPAPPEDEDDYWDSFDPASLRSDR